MEPDNKNLTSAQLSQQELTTRHVAATRGSRRSAREVEHPLGESLPVDYALKETARKTRRQVWFQIYLPLGMVILVIAVLGIGVSWAGLGTTRVWADVALVLILAPMIVIGLLAFAVLIGLTYGVFLLTGWLPQPLHRLYSVLVRIETEARRGADASVKPILVVQAVKATLIAVGRGISSIFRSS